MSIVPVWPKYGTGRATLQIGTQTKNSTLTQVIKDDFRKDGIQFLGSTKWTGQVNI